MPGKSEMAASVRTHCRAENARDKVAWLNNFAEDAVIEDPVGSDAIFRGIGELGTTFWDLVLQAEPNLVLASEPIVCGDEAIAIMDVDIGPADARTTISPLVVHFTFNRAGKIARIRSFFEY